MNTADGIGSGPSGQTVVPSGGWRIAVVMKDTLWAELLSAVCASSFPHASIRVHRSATAALEAMAGASVDLLVTGLDFPDEDGLCLLTHFRKLSRLLLVVSSRKDDWTLLTLRTARFDAFFDPEEDGPVALRRLLPLMIAGDFYLSPSVRSRLLAPRLVSVLTKLTEMELKVLTRIADGSTDVEAAPSLGISEQTLRTHRRNIMHKLNVSSSAKLVLVAARLGITQRLGIPP